MKNSNGKITAEYIRIHGLVQGVGFRPFIFRLARKFNLGGWVENRSDGVHILVQGSKPDIERFVDQIRPGAPEASEVLEIERKKADTGKLDDFEIRKSPEATDRITEVSPDIAVCKDCLRDLQFQEHRLYYPLINCTNCGPRFSIIRDLPYDRPNTTMAPFEMCDKCREEYRNVMDRRFHAQPVACNRCGPVYELVDTSGNTTGTSSVIKKTASLLKDGRIIAMKGIGGFQLVCDAGNEDAVARLRKNKNREGKPFAVMFGDMDTLEKYAWVSEAEKETLQSWRRPIVILREKGSLAPSVSMGFETVGAMLPYMPFHHMLFDVLDLPALVFTSGNLSDEPIVIRNKEAHKHLSRIADAFVHYNREIHNRNDDSVVMHVNDTLRVMRRSRGFAPNPILTGLNVEGIFAAGAELVNCFCIGKEKMAFLSQHIGDLKNPETFEFYEESFNRFGKLFRFKPTLAVHDLHPDYFSTRFVNGLDVPKAKVQHHHAHIASCMAEYNLDEEVIGVSMDGTGLGDDGHIWGSEFLICDLNSYSRRSHFCYLPLPGGDAVTKEPWRSGISLLYQVYGREFTELDIPFVKNLDPHKTEWIITALSKKINTPLSAGAGRYFDALSAILGLCPVSNFHAEAPMRLESAIHPGTMGLYSYATGDNDISLAPTVREIVEDIKQQVNASIIAAKFHTTVVDMICSQVEKIGNETGIGKVVLSGGTFQNRTVLGKSEKWLKRLGFQVFSNTRIPVNDGGIALGQLIVAAKRRELGLI